MNTEIAWRTRLDRFVRSPRRWLLGGGFIGLLFCGGVSAQMPGAPLPDRDEAKVPLATKLFDARLPSDLKAFNVVRFELAYLGFEESAERLEHYQKRRALRELVGDPPSTARSFRQAIAEEAAEPMSIAEFTASIIRRGLSVDFEAPVNRWNFRSRARLSYAEIEPGLWGAFGSSEPEKTADTSFEYLIPFTVTSRLTQAVSFGFHLPKTGIREPFCYVAHVPTDKPVSTGCKVSVPTDAADRARLLASLRHLRPGLSDYTPLSGSVQARSSYGYREEQEAKSMAYNLVHRAGCGETGTCLPGQMRRGPSGLPAAVLLVGMIWTAWMRVSGRWAGATSQEIARFALRVYVVAVVAAVAFSALDAGSGGPLKGAIGFVAAGLVAVPWSVLMASGLSERSDGVALALLWGGAAVNTIYLWVLAYGGQDDRGRKAKRN